MASTYDVGAFPPERPDKALVRMGMYGTIIRSRGLDWFRTTRHLILSSWQANDIGFLLDMGVPPVNILGVDKNLKYVQMARERYPMVPIIHCPVSNVLQGSSASNFGTIFLDFCGKIRMDLVQDMTLALRNAYIHAGYVGVTFFAARESEPAVLKALEHQDGNWHLYPEFRSALKRAAALHILVAAQLERPGINSGRVPTDCLWSPYHGGTDSLRGNKVHSSMCTVLYDTQCYSMVRDLVHPIDLSDGGRSVSLWLRKLGYTAKDIAPILNVPRQQVAGWFAVETKKDRNKDVAAPSNPVVDASAAHKDSDGGGP